MKGLFDLQTGPDLFRKLEHDYGRVRASPSDAYAAYDFVVTAWHLLEWTYPGDETAQEAICAGEPLLRVCRHLAIGAKHFEPRSKKLKEVQRTARDTAWATDSWAREAWSADSWKDDLVIHFKDEVAAVFGPQIKMLDLADRVMTMWRTILGQRAAE